MYVNLFIIRYFKKLPWNVPEEELSFFLRYLEVLDSSIYLRMCILTGFSWFSEFLLKSAETDP